jgi:WD40 repeat protein
LDGGDPVTLCALPGVTSQTPFAGGSWSPGGESIIFSSGGRLFQIPARGGDPDLLFEPAEDEQRQYAIWPQFLPLEDPRRAIVYSAGSGSAAGGWMLMTMDLQPGERRELVPGTQPIYSKQGFLLYGPPTVTEPGLRAAPFSLQTLSFTGDAFPVAATALTASVSDSDTLIYLDASAANDSGLLVWRNRSGEVLESVSQPQPGMDKPALSPDNRQAAVVSTEGGDTQIWIQDLGRRTKTPLTFGGTNQDPAWPSSGRDVAYASASAGGFRLESKSADGTGEAAVLAESQNLLLNPHWSSDGRYLLYQRAQGRSFDIVYQQIAEDGSSSEPMTLLGTAANEHIPKLSPDGRFLAYASNESGQDEIYVRTFPDGGGRLPASLDGGT